MKKFEITFTNINKECLLNSEIIKVVFGDDKEDAKQNCQDIYDDCNGNFEIIKIRRV